MAAATLLINAGEVIDVQLTSETVVIDTPMGRRPAAEPGHISNRMRLFVREEGGSEEIYDFDETNLGVRESQRVAVVRARMKQSPAPFNLMLFNLSNARHDVFEEGLRIYLGRKSFFGPPWKALAFSLGTGIVFYLVSSLTYGSGSVSAGFFGGAFAFMLYPAFWWLSLTWDRITEKMRYKAARARFIAEMDARVKAFAQAGASPAAASPS